MPADTCCVMSLQQLGIGGDANSLGSVALCNRMLSCRCCQTAGQFFAQFLPQQQETCCSETASLDMIAEGRPLLVLIVQQSRGELQAMSQHLLRGI